MRSINGDKLYRIKVKDGAHVNNHVKEDGSKAAIQFDEENNLQGPVDLIEVDEILKKFILNLFQKSVVLDK